MVRGTGGAAGAQQDRTCGCGGNRPQRSVQGCSGRVCWPTHCDVHKRGPGLAQCVRQGQGKFAHDRAREVHGGNIRADKAGRDDLRRPGAGDVGGAVARQLRPVCVEQGRRTGWGARTGKCRGRCGGKALLRPPRTLLAHTAQHASLQPQALPSGPSPTAHCPARGPPPAHQPRAGAGGDAAVGSRAAEGHVGQRRVGGVVATDARDRRARRGYLVRRAGGRACQQRG